MDSKVIIITIMLPDVQVPPTQVKVYADHNSFILKGFHSPNPWIPVWIPAMSPTKEMILGQTYQNGMILVGKREAKIISVMGGTIWSPNQITATIELHRQSCVLDIFLPSMDGKKVLINTRR